MSHASPRIIHQRTWKKETAIYFAESGETMVLTPLGIIAVEGICAGCPDLAALASWCKARSIVEDEHALSDALSELIKTLSEAEVVGPFP